MFITGPDVIKTVTGEEVEFEELGGAMTHNSKSGVAHFASDDEDACLEDARYLFSLPAAEQPRDAAARAAVRRSAADGRGARHRRPRQPEQALRHARRRAADVVDDGEFLEVHEHYAQNIICGFARLDGHAIGVVGNQPRALAGVLDIDASAKAARFVRTCDAFNIPILTFVDVPGFLPGHHAGVGRDHPPRRQAAVRVHRGDGAQDHRHHAQGLRRRLRRHGLQAHAADFNFAWPTAEVAVMGPEGAVNIIYRRDIAAVPDARRAPPEADRRLQGALRQPVHGRRARLHRRRDRPARDAAEADHGARDAATKREPGPKRKHGNIPL